MMKMMMIYIYDDRNDDDDDKKYDDYGDQHVTLLHFSFKQTLKQ